MKNLITVLIVSILSSITLLAEKYSVDINSSNVGFKVRYMVISHIKGKFEKFNGTFEYDETTNTLIGLRGTIKVDSINTKNPKRDADLRSEKFFDADKYPKITFILSKIDGDTAYGKFTIRGVTREEQLNFENKGVTKDLLKKRSVNLKLTGKLSRKDYGVRLSKILEIGGIAVSDTIKLDVQIKGTLAN